jgi:hypothetical protein
MLSIYLLMYERCGIIPQKDLSGKGITGKVFED